MHNEAGLICCEESRMVLTDKVIAVTGGARGLGYAMALRLGQQGARMALLDMSD